MAKNFTEKDFTPADLLQAGIDHLSAAELLLKNDSIFFDSAGYLAHIGIELLLKSFILYINREFEGIHSLKDLTHQLISLEKTLVFTEREKKLLGIYPISRICDIQTGIIR